jgi:membrane protein
MTDEPTELFARVRPWVEGRPVLDHAWRVAVRDSAVRGWRLAAGMTYYAFLALFPLAALVYTAVGIIGGVFPELRQRLLDGLQAALPGIAGDDLESLVAPGAATLTTVGLVSLVLLFYAGVRWVWAMRESMRTVARVPIKRDRWLLRRFRDLGVLLILGAGLLASLAASSILLSASSWLLDALGVEGRLDSLVVQTVGLVAVLMVDVVLWWLMLWRLPGLELRPGLHLQCAALGGVGFAGLTWAGSLIVAPSLANPVYGVFAVTIGLLIWINLVSRLTLLVAAWGATAEPAPHPS